jgi:mannose-1-phosphate guanylyltransferase
MTNLYPVVMAGGVGSRLWPLSRELYPKQLLNLISSSQTLLQSSLQRLHGSTLPFGQPWIICNQDHRFLVAEQLRPLGVEVERIILEPVGRNTAPAIALAAFEVLKEDPKGMMLVLAADHDIQQPEAFHHVLQQAVLAAEQDWLVTFGIHPAYPETGYGYIEKGDLLGAGFGAQLSRVQEFKEKPDTQTAQSFVSSGRYFWNSGMFLMNAKTYLTELEAHCPEVYQHCKQAVEQAKRSYGYIQIPGEVFQKCPDISVDYAVMEPTQKAAVIGMEAGWSDVGSWKTLWELGAKDDDSNVIIGDVKAFDCDHNYIRSEKRLVAALGVKDLLIVDTADAVLVAHKDHAQAIKRVVSELKQEQRSEAEVHTRDYRPWGNYETIDESKRFKVKRIVVSPGAKLSLQRHHHRAEHWIVVAGTAEVRCGDQSFLLSENESTYIPLGERHQLSNPGKIPLEIIEVQSGAYLGEDDIERFEDVYGRT